MMRNVVARQDKDGDDALLRQIGAFLRLHGLGPEPANYSFGYAALTNPAIGSAVARLTDGGVRLSRREIEELGGTVALRQPTDEPSRQPSRVGSPHDGEAAQLVAQTQAQVDGFADLMRSIRQETTGFGRDLQESADAMRRAPVGTDEIARITGEMVARIRDAEVRLATATAETDTLRAKLGEARAMARRDPLTGLANRLAFEEAFAAGANPADPTPANANPANAKSPAPRCLAVADVDHFKRFNDDHGHAVGDRVLSAIGRGLETACAGQLVARYGGEEFAVLIDGVSLVDAAAMLDAARHELAGRNFRDRETGAALRRITLSAGVVALRAGETLPDALARADQLLYAAKDQGRDRVCAG